MADLTQQSIKFSRDIPVQLNKRHPRGFLSSQNHKLI